MHNPGGTDVTFLPRIVADKWPGSPAGVRQIRPFVSLSTDEDPGL